MAALTSATRNRLPGQSFALPGRRYPIEDASHARNALARVSQHGSPAEKARVRAKVRARFPAIRSKTPSLSDHLTSMRARGAFKKATR